MRKQFETILSTFAVFSIIGLISCSKLDVPKETPGCIKNKIDKLKSEEVTNPPSSVWRYDYNGQTVYYIPAVCCDVFSELYNDDCNLICNPDGGFSGNGDGRCTDFFTERSNETLIWKDNR